MTDRSENNARTVDLEEPLISIVTAVYNRVETLPEALSSVERQTYGRVQHVIIDGGSSDGSIELIRARVRADAIVVSEPDNGIYDALNKGVARATGDVIGILHSDDLFASDHVLAKVAAGFAQADVMAVYGDLDYVRRDDPARVVRHWEAGQFRRDRLGWGWMPPHPALFLRRSVMEGMGVYDTSFRIAGDYDAILRYFSLEGFRTAYIPEVLVKMRLGGESNRSLGRIIRKSREDYGAIRKNRIGGLHTLVFKNLRKIGQFL
jgi:glycosyltransferase involved in cell wall biosynthesis